MPKIQVLSAFIANQIAAGEVVERPWSVVKELVENAVDAHATAITIEVENGGMDCIRIIDNGAGIPDEDCETAFLRHATSKIASVDDLGRIATLGFRGEALASIAAVARVTLTTRTAEDELGTLIRYEGGECKEHRRIGCPEGTTIEVRNLFYNVPARLKFLKSARSESGAIGDYAAKLLLSLPQIAFHYVNQGKTVYQSAGDGSLKNALISVYGVSVAPHLCAVCFDDGYMKIEGYVGTPEISRVNRTGQIFFLNGRIIRSAALSNAVGRAFDTRLLIGRYPFCVLHIRLALAEVDVNVHPAKLEVRFADEQRVARSLCAACGEALIRNYVPNVEAKQTVPQPVQAHSNVVERIDLRTPIPKSTFSVQETPSASFPPPAVPTFYRPSAPAATFDELPTSKRDWATKSFDIRVAKQEDSDESKPQASNCNIPRFDVRPMREKAEQQDLFRQKDQPLAEPFSIIGVAFSTYWFIQQGEIVYCMDQHAAHERLLYDALIAKRTDVVSQALLMPEEITLLPSDYELYQQKKDELTEFGFVFSEKSGTILLLAAVPQVNGIPLKSAFLLDVLHDAQPTRAALTQSACKHAVKAGEPITSREIEQLLNSFAGSETPLTCPHGRPVFVRLSKLEIEKWFKRVL